MPDIYSISSNPGESSGDISSVPQKSLNRSVPPEKNFDSFMKKETTDLSKVHQTTPSNHLRIRAEPEEEPTGDLPPIIDDSPPEKDPKADLPPINRKIGDMTEEEWKQFNDGMAMNCFQNIVSEQKRHQAKMKKRRKEIERA